MDNKYDDNYVESDDKCNKINESNKHQSIDPSTTQSLNQTSTNCLLIDISSDTPAIEYEEINDYIKGEMLGSGSFAVVYEFVDKRTLVRRVAKVIGRGVIKKDSKGLIRREIDLVFKLQHKNVIKFIDVFETFIDIYIFMEYCVGPLSDILKEALPQGLPKWQCHHYFVQVIDGLKYLHSKGVYHRDIKEDNLLVNNSHDIKIIDFGVSYVVEDFSATDLIYNEIQGSPYYNPPELQTDLPLISGSKFDIWSTGVLLFRLVTNSYPFLTNGEDIFNKNSYNFIRYPDIILTDKLLLNLFKGIFITDYNKRFTFSDIEEHPWIQFKHPTDCEPRIEFKSKETGDEYRGMTLLPKLRFKYERKLQYSDLTSEANLRTDRVRDRRQTADGRHTPMQRLIQFGLLDLN
ncbi:serine/threonine-protein kinase STK11-like [Oppia nitens]|uniref:serine/threonine-protein kinase STK11-like n=1 Tax=Oppia nitens TaxID=1686743 RepID=UPI0023DB84E9|nr:serine/threonine-protein kinase STK11-like [Oppia nitens]